MKNNAISKILGFISFAFLMYLWLDSELLDEDVLKKLKEEMKQQEESNA